MTSKIKTSIKQTGFFIVLLSANLVFAQKPIIDWVSIPAGTFKMGSPRNEADREEYETQHQVTLSAFKMSKYEITVEQFKAFIDATGYVTEAEKGTGGHKGSSLWNGKKQKTKAGVNWQCDEKGNQRPSSGYSHPVMHVSWNDAIEFAKWMNCSLPTEAEWEYAARAGTATTFYTGKCLTTDQANYNGDYPYQNCGKGLYRGKTLPVGSYPANPWNLCDMYGNVNEWCTDWFDNFSTQPETDPQGSSSGIHRILRGGGWSNPASFSRSANRSCSVEYGRYDNTGFRLVSHD